MIVRTACLTVVWALFMACLSGCGSAKMGYRKMGKDKRGPAIQLAEQAVEEAANTERYEYLVENQYVSAAREPLSTFSVDVDTASYANVRRFLTDRQLPPAGAVRVEEMINYFRYNYPQPQDDRPFAVSLDTTTCPWNEKHQLVRIGLQGKRLEEQERPDCNLVFLLDVSGSMMDQDKLPLVQSAMRMFVERLSPRDRVAIVVYAGATGLVLPSTPANQQSVILSALDRLQAGGSTNGGAGIQLAYRVAEANMIPGGVNRVLLCTDGDFNVGTSSDDQLVRLAKKKAQSGVTLSVLGFGRGNLNDSMMEKISNTANGNYGYVDSLREAQKVLVEQVNGTLVTIAKDVKIQVDFNPAYVKEYRLIGYANRMLRAEDFKDDKKDAGDIGAGHQVTAFYEIVPPGEVGMAEDVDASEFQQTPTTSAGKLNGKLLTVRLRWKAPAGDKSQETRTSLLQATPVRFADADPDLRFAAAVAAMGLVLRDSKYKGNANYDFVIATATAARGKDPHGYRQEFMQLVRQASLLAKPKS